MNTLVIGTNFVELPETASTNAALAEMMASGLPEGTWDSVTIIAQPENIIAINAFGSLSILCAAEGNLIDIFLRFIFCINPCFWMLGLLLGSDLLGLTFYIIF